MSKQHRERQIEIPGGRGGGTIINRAIEHCTLSTWRQAEFSRLLNAYVTGLTRFTIYFRYLALAVTFLYLMPNYFVFSSIWVQHGLGCFSITSFKYRKIMGSFWQQSGVLFCYGIAQNSETSSVELYFILSASKHKLASQTESVCKFRNLTIGNIFPNTPTNEENFQRHKFTSLSTRNWTQ